MSQIFIKLSVPDGKIPACSSRFWGNPDLPGECGYPMYTDDEGDQYPYFFICQINLEELAPYDKDRRLPHAGLLAFFAKIDCYAGYDAASDCIGSSISSPEDVKVLYFPDCTDFEEKVLVDEDGNPTSPAEMKMEFSGKTEKYADEHIVFAEPSHREWETWDSPFEEWEILLQVDSFDGENFSLNFMDCGVLDFLIHPDDLKRRFFGNVRAIVLST